MSLVSTAKTYGKFAVATLGVVEGSQLISRYTTDPFLRFGNSIVGSALNNADIGALHMTVGFGLSQTLNYFLKREKDAEGKVKNSNSRKIIAVALTVAGGAAAFYFGADYIDPWLRMKNPITGQVLDNPSVGAGYMALGFWVGRIINKTTNENIKKLLR